MKLLKPDEYELEKTLEREVGELANTISPPPDSPDVIPSKWDDAQVDVKTNRDLLPRSKASFMGHIEQLTKRIEAINNDINSARIVRDEAIARAEGHYKEFVHQAERDLYEVKTLKGAVELAIVALGGE